MGIIKLTIRKWYEGLVENATKEYNNRLKASLMSYAKISEDQIEVIEFNPDKKYIKLKDTSKNSPYEFIAVRHSTDDDEEKIVVNRVRENNFADETTYTLRTIGYPHYLVERSYSIEYTSTGKQAKIFDVKKVEEIEVPFDYRLIHGHPEYKGKQKTLGKTRMCDTK